MEKLEPEARTSMSRKAILWLIVLIVIISCWFYLSADMKINYEHHNHLIDRITGEKKQPKDLLKLGKVIKYTEDYINSTTPLERLYDLEYNLHLENPIPFRTSYSKKEDLIKSGWPVANQQLCGIQLGWILNQLNTIRNYTSVKGKAAHELTNYMDTFGRPEPGFFSGVITWTGSYAKCRKQSLNNGEIKTRYCSASMRPESWPKNETVYPPTTIRVGLCLPETCDTLSFKNFNSSIEILAKHGLPEYFKNSLNLESMFCLPDERSPIREIPLSGQIYINIVLGWVSLVVIANVFYERLLRKQRNLVKFMLGDNIKQQEECKSEIEKINWKSLPVELIEALSVRYTLKKFKMNPFLVDHKNGHRVRVNMAGFDFVKVFMTIAIVGGHSGYISSLYTKNLSNRIEMNVGPFARLVASLVQTTDTFFVFFGVLASYTLMRKCRMGLLSRPIVWLGIQTAGFLKITPLFMLIYWYARSVSPYTGSGPWWDYGVDRYSVKGACMSEAWWKSIPYFGNIGYPAVPACLLPGWFIVSYSQLSLLVPLIIYLLHELPSYFYKGAFVGSILIVSVSSVCWKLYTQVSVADEAYSLYGGFLINNLEKFQSTGYISTLGHLGGVTIGCFVGYLLRMYELGKIAAWPNWLTNSSTLYSTVILHIAIVLTPLARYQFPNSLITLNEFVITNFIVSITWPLINSILILNCATVFNHKAILRGMSNTFFHVFNRLGLTILLIHWEILFIGVTGFEMGPGYGFYIDILQLWTFALIFSFLISLIIYILIEAPLARLLMITYERIGKKELESFVEQ